MPQPTDAARDLLCGLLALQNGLIDQGALFTAFAAWTRDRARPLADHLVVLGQLDAERRAVVEAIADLHVRALGGDPEKSLAVLAVGRSTRESLCRACGPDVEPTLGHVGSARRSTRDDDPALRGAWGLGAGEQAARGAADDYDDPDRTGSYCVGSATSDGQRFRILRPHARGGLGAVFVALDSELHREVALKQILEKHIDDAVSRQRFVAEAEITGGLEHPGVVPVYGLGTDADGRPYYAMRFIKGNSLKEAIEQFHGEPGRVSVGSQSHGEPGRVSVGSVSRGEPGRVSAGSRSTRQSRTRSTKTRGANASPLALRQLLRRFLDVCNAIDYAHSRGVIHRDIKPANIIVGKYGETLVVDWGLAKAVGRADPSAGENTLLPSSGGSSETLPGSALGTPAYMSPEQARGELDRVGVRSDVYSLGATLYCLLTGKAPFGGDDIGAVLHAVQQGQFRRPSQHAPALDKALEAVCLKAMATMPEDRYPTPRALADDLDRWMADEPVTAWREPFSRRARRWARRNRTAVTAAAVALLAGVFGLSAVLAVQTKANAALAAANAELTRSQAAVQARYNLAVAAIKTFHTGVSEDFLLKQDQFKEVRDRLLKSASDFYGKLGALLGKESDLASRRALWQANYEVAELTEKVGTPEDALAAHRQVLAAREALAAQSHANLEIKADVGRSLATVAALLESTGETREAEAMYRKAQALLVELAPTIAGPTLARVVLAECRSRLGRLLHATGRDDEALSVYRLARADQEVFADAPGATAESRQDLAATIHRVAGLLAATGKSPEAEAEYRKALTILEKLADENRGVTDFRARLAASHNSIGLLLSRTGKSTEAAAEYRTALSIQQRLADDNPAVSQFVSELAIGHANLGNLLLIAAKLPEAESEYKMALLLQKKLADDYPTVNEFRSSMAESHNSLGLLLSARGRSREAEAEYRQALAIQQKLADENPAVTRFRHSLAGSHDNLGGLLARTGKPLEALAEYRRALAIQEKLADDSPAVSRFGSDLANSHNGLGIVLADMGKSVEAAVEYRQALAIQQIWPTRIPP
ncbi:MAG: protein kinase domain-containing protein [Isosphaeraceae bacterium]